MYLTRALDIFCPSEKQPDSKFVLLSFLSGVAAQQTHSQGIVQSLPGGTERAQLPGLLVLSSIMASIRLISFMTPLAVFAAFMLIGLRDYLANLEDNKCQMTYMFEIPEYIGIPLPKQSASRFHRYALYLYGEGLYADRSRRLQLSGIPVLFIPGNAGSHKQVRSLASVALRKAEGLSHHFNYFSVDFDEDLSGIFGGVLLDQTEFVIISIKRILELYKRAAHPPSSVVLIGHSMGGVIARALLTSTEFDPHLVHTIITLGTPHQHPVLSSDPLLAAFYKSVNGFWRREADQAGNPPSRLRHISMVSVAGGFRDVLVRSSVASLQGVISESQGISVVATSVPKAWVSVDHLCLCWCKQLVLVTNRALFDMVDPSSRQITQNVTYRMDVLHHYFVDNPGLKHFQARKGTKTVDVTPVIVNKKLWRFKGTSNAKNLKRLYAFPAESDAYGSLVILTSLQSHQWIFGCIYNSTAKVCKHLTDLSAKSQLIPWQSKELKFIHLRLQDFQQFSHFAVHVQNPKALNVLWAEYLVGNDPVSTIELPWFFSTQLFDIGPDRMFVTLSLEPLSKVWKVYSFKFNAVGCEKPSGLVARVRAPWFNEDSYFSGVGGSVSVTVKLHHPRPRGRHDPVQIHAWLDSRCSYKLTVKQDLHQALGQMFRFYGVQLPVWSYSLMFLILAWQLSFISVTSHCPSFFSLITNPSQSFRVLLLLFQTHFVVSQIAVAFCVMNGEEGQHDWLPGVHDLRTFDWVIPLLVIMSSAVIITVIIFVWVAVFTKLGGSVLSVFPFATQEEAIGLKPMDIILSLLCSLVSLFSCGVWGIILALCLCLYQGWKYTAILKCYQIDPPGSKTPKHVQNIESAANFSLSICSILVLVLLTNSPALAVWVKNLKHAYHLPSDHTALVSAIVAFNAIVLTAPTKVPRSVVYLCFILGVAIPQAALIQLYLIPYAFYFILLVLNALRLVKHLTKPKKKDEWVQCTAANDCDALEWTVSDLARVVSDKYRRLPSGAIRVHLSPTWLQWVVSVSITHFVPYCTLSEFITGGGGGGVHVFGCVCVGGGGGKGVWQILETLSKEKNSSAHFRPCYEPFILFLCY